MSDKSVNILLISSWYPSRENATAGSFVHEQALLLRDNGHMVTVIHPFLLGTFAGAITKRSTVSFEQEDGISVLRVGVAPPLPFFRAFSYRYCFYRVRKAMKKVQLNPEEFKIIHSHAAFMGGYVAMRLSQLVGIPFLHTEHASGLFFNPKQYTSTDKRLLFSIYSSAKKVLFVSRFSLNNTLRILNLSDSSQFVVVPNVVKRDFFREPIIRGSIPTNFMMVGDFIPVKNHKLLFEAWSIVQTKYSGLRLTLIGDGLHEIELAKRFPELNLDQITIIPRLSREELRKLMTRQDVLLSTSVVETFGLSIAEAQALGIPVVVTDSGGVTDIITHETGIVTAPNAISFSKGITQLIESYEYFDSTRIRQLTKDRFSEEVIMNQLDSIYKQVL